MSAHYLQIDSKTIYDATGIDPEKLHCKELLGGGVL